MDDLKARLKVGVPLGLVSILIIFTPKLGTPWIFNSFAILLGTILLVEISRIVKAPLSYYLLGLGVPLLFCPPEAVLVALLIFGATRAIEPTKEELVGLFSLLLIGGGISSLVSIKDPYLVFTSVLAVCVADISAYFAGTKFGGRKLSPLSPNKTLSGLLGGVISGSLVFGILNGDYALGIALIMVSVLSDLLESRIKRLLEVKDTGSFLGAHGGFFDRIDSHLGAWIILYVWL